MKLAAVRVSLAVLALLGDAAAALADSVTFGGLITQSTQDGTGPASNNPSLNKILDGDQYSVTLSFSGSFSSPGTYALAAGALSFADPTAPASESAFGTFLCDGTSSIACLTVSADGAFDDISLLACLTTGVFGCVENQLDVNFKIAAASLNSQNVPALAIVPITPLDLLEDDGVTDIQGSVTNYSYTGASPVPEPSTSFLLSVVLAWLAVRSRRSRTAF